jgi:hypothetical protein
LSPVKLRRLTRCDNCLYTLWTISIRYSDTTSHHHQQHQY